MKKQGLNILSFVSLLITVLGTSSVKAQTPFGTLSLQSINQVVSALSEESEEVTSNPFPTAFQKEQQRLSYVAIKKVAPPEDFGFMNNVEINSRSVFLRINF